MDDFENIQQKVNKIKEAKDAASTKTLAELDRWVEEKEDARKNAERLYNRLSQLRKSLNGNVKTYVSLASNVIKFGIGSSSPLLRGAVFELTITAFNDEDSFHLNSSSDQHLKNSYVGLSNYAASQKMILDILTERIALVLAEPGGYIPPYWALYSYEIASYISAVVAGIGAWVAICFGFGWWGFFFGWILAYVVGYAALYLWPLALLIISLQFVV